MRSVNFTFLLIVTAICPIKASAQYTFLDLPRASQMASVSQRIGNTEITVTYSRPAVGGRNIFGEIVPFSEVWRVGANENTTISFSDPVIIGNITLDAGKYGLHMIPEDRSDWTVIFSKDHNSWGSFYYDQERDATRISIKPVQGTKIEHLMFVFESINAHSADLVMKWDDVNISIPIKVDVHGSVIPRIDAQLKGLTSFSWEPWYEAAHYAHQEKLNMDQAMKWIDKSIAIRPNFHNQLLKVEILEKMGRSTEATNTVTDLIAIASNSELNAYGYSLLNQGKHDEAIKIFELNVKRHPKDPNVYDSLGEGYMVAKKSDLAIRSFKKCLSMEPSDAVKVNSIRCLKKMGVDTSEFERKKS